MQETPLFNYDELAERLFAAGAESGAAEAHGLLAGMICAGGMPTPAVWLGHLLGEGNTPGTAARESADLLDRLRTDIIRQFDDDGFGFTLLLPHDEAPLGERTRELGRWCAGFLYGLALGGVREDVAVSDIVSEVMKDFYEISHADFVDESTDEAEEAAYMEIVEYVRMSVLLLYAELHPTPARTRLQ
jgi:hypothetical protein